jgi:hypothetical protein
MPGPPVIIPASGEIIITQVPNPKGHASTLVCVIPAGGDLMKKCPYCYAIMRESTKPTAVPELQRKATDGTPEVSAARARYECGQCGHMEESFAKPAPAPTRALPGHLTPSQR